MLSHRQVRDMMNIHIPITLEEGATAPFRKYATDAGWDLHVSRAVDIMPGEVIDVHTDLYTCIPPGLYGRITGRSSTMRKHHLLVNEGIIDSGFTGELFICVKNLSDSTFHVMKGMRLAQIIFGEVLPVMLVETEHTELPTGERGRSGFGSTGV